MIARWVHFCRRRRVPHVAVGGGHDVEARACRPSGLARTGVPSGARPRSALTERHGYVVRCTALEPRRACTWGNAQSRRGPRGHRGLVRIADLGRLSTHNPAEGSTRSPTSRATWTFVEVNSTFYRGPWTRRRRGAGWIASPTRRSSRFHGEAARSGSRTSDDTRVHARRGRTKCIADSRPCMNAGKLGAVLLQFPWSFRRTEENRQWLDDVTRAFEEFPLVVEVRHASWAVPEFYDELAERGIGFVNIDQPLFRQLGQAERDGDGARSATCAFTVATTTTGSARTRASRRGTTTCTTGRAGAVGGAHPRGGGEWSPGRLRGHEQPLPWRGGRERHAAHEHGEG